MEKDNAYLDKARHFAKIMNKKNEEYRNLVKLWEDGSGFRDGEKMKEILKASADYDIARNEFVHFVQNYDHKKN